MNTTQHVPAGFHARPEDEESTIFDGPAHGLVYSFWTADTGTQVSLSRVPEEMTPADAQALRNDLSEVLTQLHNG